MVFLVDTYSQRHLNLVPPGSALELRPDESREACLISCHNSRVSSLVRRPLPELTRFFLGAMPRLILEQLQHRSFSLLSRLCHKDTFGLLLRHQPRHALRGLLPRFNPDGSKYRSCDLEGVVKEQGAYGYTVH